MVLVVQVWGEETVQVPAFAVPFRSSPADVHVTS
jgi:hypothetical protein